MPNLKKIIDDFNRGNDSENFVYKRQEVGDTKVKRNGGAKLRIRKIVSTNKYTNASRE
jgi:hypothetical protein